MLDISRMDMGMSSASAPSEYAVSIAHRFLRPEDA